MRMLAVSDTIRVVLRKSIKLGIVTWIFIVGLLSLLFFMEYRRPTRAEVSTIVQEVVRAELTSQRASYDIAYADLARKVNLVSLAKKTDLDSLGTKVDADFADLRRNLQSDLDRLAQKDDLTNLGLQIGFSFVDLRQDLRVDLAQKPSLANVRDLLNQISVQISGERLTGAEIEQIVRHVLRDVAPATVVDVKRVLDATNAQRLSITNVSDLPASWQIGAAREGLDQTQTVMPAPIVLPAKVPDTNCCPYTDPTRAVGRYK